MSCETSIGARGKRILYLPHCYSQQRQREKKANIYPIRLAMEATWYQNEGHKVEWDKDGWLEINYDKIIREPEGLPFLSLPKPDRILTKAMDYAYDNGNFKYTPGTYIQSASSCWWGKCTFCVEKDKPYQIRSVDEVIDEIRECKLMGFREAFDDSATFPTGRWLDDFTKRLENLGKTHFSCNMRLCDIDYVRIRRAGFRMLLFGIESANQGTLDRINKGVKVEDIKYIKKASEAGLDCHGAFMVGCPGESDKDSMRTLRLAHSLLRKGWLRTAQMSLYNDGNCNEAHHKYVKRLYHVAWYPSFWTSQLRKIKDKDDLRYLWRSIKKGVGI